MKSAQKARQALRAALGTALAEKLRAAPSTALRAQARARTEAWRHTAPARVWRAALAVAPNVGESALSARGLATRCQTSAVRAMARDLEALDPGHGTLAGAARTPACVRATHALIEAEIAGRAPDDAVRDTAHKILRSGWCARDRRIIAVSVANLLALTRADARYWTDVAGAPEWLKREALREPALRRSPRREWVREAAHAYTRRVGWTGGRAPCAQAVNALAERWRWRSPKPPLLALWACAGEGVIPESDAAWAAMIRAQEHVLKACAEERVLPAARAVATRVEAGTEEGPRRLDALLRAQALALIEQGVGSERRAREALAWVEARVKATDPPPTLVPADGHTIVRACRWQVLHHGAARVIGATRLRLGAGTVHDVPARVREQGLGWAGTLHDVHEPERWEERRRESIPRARARAAALGTALGEVMR